MSRTHPKFAQQYYMRPRKELGLEYPSGEKVGINHFEIDSVFNFLFSCSENVQAP